MGSEIVRQAMGTAFGILQALFIAAIIGAFKMYGDVRKLRYDVNNAFREIRKLKGECPRARDMDDDEEEES